jgi:DNA-binding MarR family transcriptional regulator
VAVIGRLKRDGPATTSDLARAESVKPRSMGVTLAVLERDGMVARAADPADGRQFFHDLTQQGHDARTQHRLLKVSWLASALAKLDEQDTADLRSTSSVASATADYETASARQSKRWEDILLARHRVVGEQTCRGAN